MRASVLCANIYLRRRISQLIATCRLWRVRIISYLDMMHSIPTCKKCITWIGEWRDMAKLEYRSSTSIILWKKGIPFQYKKGARHSILQARSIALIIQIYKKKPKLSHPINLHLIRKALTAINRIMRTFLTKYRRRGILGRAVTTRPCRAVGLIDGALNCSGCGQGCGAGARGSASFNFAVDCHGGESVRMPLAIVEFGMWIFLFVFFARMRLKIFRLVLWLEFEGGMGLEE